MTKKENVFGDVESLSDLVIVRPKIGAGAFCIVSEVAIKNHPSAGVFALKRYRAKVEGCNKETLQLMVEREDELYNKLDDVARGENVRRHTILQCLKSLPDADSGYPARIIALCDGSLHQLVQFRVRNFKFFTDDEVLLIAVDVLLALSSLHDWGYLHRDIHAGNVLFLNDGPHCRFVLSDFGLVCNGQQQAESTLTDTSPLCAPELDVKSTAYDASVDVWDLGVMLLSVISRMQLEPEFVRLRRMEEIKDDKAAYLRSVLKEYSHRFPKTSALIETMLESRSKRLSATNLLRKFEAQIPESDIEAWCSQAAANIKTDMAIVAAPRTEKLPAQSTFSRCWHKKVAIGPLALGALFLLVAVIVVLFGPTRALRYC